MENDLRKFLGEMYEKYGHNKITLAISKIVDEYDTEAQRGKLVECIKIKSQKQLQI